MNQDGMKVLGSAKYDHEVMFSEIDHTVRVALTVVSGRESSGRPVESADMTLIQRGLLKGIRYAFANLGFDGSRMEARIDDITAAPGATEDDVAYSACRAVWKALETSGRNPPYIDWGNARIVFPGFEEGRE